MRVRGGRIHGGDVENCALALLGHDLANGLARQHGAENIEIEDPAQSVGGKVEELQFWAGSGRGLIASRTVDQAVDFAQARGYILRSLGDAVAVENIALVEGNLLALLAEAIDQGLGGLDIQVRMATCAPQPANARPFHCPGFLRPR